MRRRIPAAIAMLLASACGHGRGAAYERALAEGSRAGHAGRDREAAIAYQKAAEATTSVHDRDVARYLAADRYAHAGDTEKALSLLDALAAETPSRELTSRASVAAALLRIQRVDAELGYTSLAALLARAPNHAATRTAFRHLLAQADDSHTGLAWLDAQLATLKGTRLEESVLFERAIRLEKQDDKEKARDAFVDLAERFPYPKGPYFDDALEHAAILEEKLNRPAKAAELLERMLDVRTSAWMVGSNQRPRFSAALYRLAGLYAGPLADSAKAKASYKRLYNDFESSTLRDNALWDEAWLWKREGKNEEFCDRLLELVKRFPTSRFAPCAERFCPAAKAPANTTCHEYVLRSPESTRAGSEPLR